MIVNEEQKWIVATAPQAAALTVHRALATLPGSRWIVGVNVDSWADHWTTRVPNNWKTYRRFIVVRNPSTRLLSLADHYNRQRVADGHKPWELDQFVGERHRLNWFYSSTQTEWAAGLLPCGVIKTETLKGQLQQLTGRRLKLTAATSERRGGKEYFRGLRYGVLVDLYQEFLPDFTFGYIDQAITPQTAAIYSGGVDF